MNGWALPGAHPFIFEVLALKDRTWNIFTKRVPNPLQLDSVTSGTHDFLALLP